jgi:uncharacterized phage-associated protein
MLLNHEREKMMNAIIFFANHTKYLGKVKLFKLLYFLDFEHFKETGRSVTGLDYFAWPKGPVPVKLVDEIESPKADLLEKIKFSKIQIKENFKLNVEPVAKFNPSHFSKREMKIMERLAKEFEKTLAEDMIEATHLENLPWHKIYNEQGSKQKLIPYELALRAQENEVMKSFSMERLELLNHFGKT